jgi:alpha-ketoglutarate-dependent taurine dioxygenase
MSSQPGRMAPAATSANESTAYGQLEVRKLHSSLGAEVRNVDFSTPPGSEMVSAMKQAWADHLVIVVPGQDITDRQHVDATACFGTPEVFHQTIFKSSTVREIFRVSNTDEDGNIMPAGDPTMRQLSSARRWHTDSSYRQKPAIGSLLHGIEISRSGGETCFTNMYDVYEALPTRLREAVSGRRACHDFGLLSRLTGSTPPTEEERAAMPPVWQPLVRRHPVTGKVSLYISPIYNNAVEGMGVAEGEDLITELTEFAGKEEFVYRHRWEPHDIVMWDNRCTMHYVTPHDPSERRVMHRTTIEGDAAVVPA